MLKIIEKTKIWFGISIIIIVLGIFKMATSGLVVGIDFAGGSIVQVDMIKDFDKAKADTIVLKYAPDATTNKAANAEETNKVMKELEIKSKSIPTDKVNLMLNELKETFGKEVKVVQQEDIGASVGAETRNKAVAAMVLATIAMLVYIGVRFEFKFAVSAILALVHDVFIVLAVYAWWRLPIDSGFVAAVLTVIGYSINDTIVVFDRIRENQKWMVKADINELANASITQTMIRSINTVLTVIITLVSVYIFVPSIRTFSLPLLIGIASGCYSSIFMATPLWVIFTNMSKKRSKAMKPLKSK
jgi:preprotein translocase subunit SecF